MAVDEPLHPPGKHHLRDEWMWRTSGRDGRRHVFPSHGGYLDPESVLAIWHCPYDGRGFVHEVEIVRALCEAEIPIAHLLPHDDTPTCTTCHHRVNLLKPAP